MVKLLPGISVKKIVKIGMVVEPNSGEKVDTHCITSFHICMLFIFSDFND